MSVPTLPKVYDPASTEAKWYNFWLEQGLFHADVNSDAPPFSIVIPPPNITGSLHMGHALNNTLQDILTRWKRMEGHNVLWMPGTDHAGIATQNVIEQQLADEGTDRHALGRDAFVERVWAWREDSGGTIVKRTGAAGAGSGRATLQATRPPNAPPGRTRPKGGASWCGFRRSDSEISTTS